MSNRIDNQTGFAFPIIALKNKSLIYFARNEDEISICTKTGYLNGFYNGLQIIDSNGFKYKIEGAKKIGTVGPLWGYNIFLNQKIRVKLLFEHTARIGIELEDFKKEILVILKSSHFIDLNYQMEQRLVNSDSFKEILAYLSNDFFGKY